MILPTVLDLAVVLKDHTEKVLANLMRCLLIFLVNIYVVEKLKEVDGTSKVVQEGEIGIVCIGGELMGVTLEVLLSLRKFVWMDEFLKGLKLLHE